MNPSEFGPFANIVGIACALVATFGVLLTNMVGSVKKWTWLTSDSPSFLVTAGARVLAVAVMAGTYVLISPSNFGLFLGLAIACGAACFLLIARFDRLRKTHILAIPVVSSKGKGAVDSHGKPVMQNVVIGTEEDMNPTAKEDLATARKKHGGLSVADFMSGYGGRRVNNPEALWERGLLARTGNRLTVTLMCVLLLAVLTVFVAAFVVEVAGRA